MELKGKKVLILVEDDYEDLEGWYPKLRLLEEGAGVVVAGPEKKVYKSKHWYPMEADCKVDDVNWEDFDAVIIPGGYAPDRLRRYPAVVDIVRAMGQAGKVVASICHGAWVPISAGIVKGKRMTCFFAIKDDLKNAGALYEDKVVVVDGNMISSRQPSDLPDFLKAIIKTLS